VLDLILDKGLVIDAFVRVSLVGIELVTVDLRVVIASVDTYLRYAAAAENLQLYNRGGEKSLPGMVSGMKKAQLGKKALGIAERGEKALEHSLTGRNRGREERGHEEQGDEEEGITGSLTRGVKNVVGRVVDTFTGGDEDEDQSDRGDQEEDRGEARHRHEGREGREERHERRSEQPHRKPAKVGGRR